MCVLKFAIFRVYFVDHFPGLLKEKCLDFPVSNFSFVVYWYSTHIILYFIVVYSVSFWWLQSCHSAISYTCSKVNLFPYQGLGFFLSFFEATGRCIAWNVSGWQSLHCLLKWWIIFGQLPGGAVWAEEVQTKRLKRERGEKTKPK